MSKIKNLLIILSIFTLMITGIVSNTYAKAVEVTNENLKNAFEKFIALNTTEEKYDITVSDKSITVEADGEKYTINYTLKETPTFSFDISIKKGMTYEEFKTQVESAVLPIMGYVTVANIQGIEFDDSISYFTSSLMRGVLTGAIPLSTFESYTIVDDLNGKEVEKTDDPKVIYTSEFGDKVMEIVNDVFKKDISVTDSQVANTYTWNVKKQDATADACKIVSTLSVNTNGDFAILEGYADTDEEDDSPTTQTPQTEKPATETPKVTETPKTTTETQTPKTTTTQKTTETPKAITETTINSKIYPKTGFENIIMISIIIVTLITILLAIKNNKYKDIK